MDLRQLTTFRTVVATGSFTRAAAALNYVQPNVSAQIQALEAELGVQLFDRLGNRIQLTEAGQRLVRHAERILQLVEETRTLVGSDDLLAGTLTLSAPETICSYYLPELLQTFCARFPAVAVNFYAAGRGSAALRRSAQDGLVDVALVLDEPFQAAGLMVEPLLNEPIEMVLAPWHMLARAETVDTADLRDQTLLLPDVGCSYRNMFNRMLAEEGVYPSNIMEIGSIESLKRFALAGLGVALLPRVALRQELAQGQLQALRWSRGTIEVTLYMLWNRARWATPALQQFLALAREQIGQLLALAGPA